MEDELESLNFHKVWEIVDTPTNIKTVKSKWVYSVTYDENKMRKFKARLVAAGFNQVKHRDFAESYASQLMIVNIEAWRMLL